MPVINLFDFTLSPRFFKTNPNAKSPLLVIDSGSYISNADFQIASSLDQVLIGKFSSLAGSIKFMLECNHNYKNVTTYPFENQTVKAQLEKMYPKENLKYNFSHKKFGRDPRQIIIGNDVWIGHGATIMGGVHIGSGAVVGTNAVVTKNIPPYAIAVGNPARVIKYRFDEETVKKFMVLKWWNWDLKKIYDNVPIMGDTEKFLDMHYKPELENISYTRMGGGTQIEQYRAEGRKVFSFIADFRAFQPLWKRVIKGFLQSNLKNAVMLFFLTDAMISDDYKKIIKLIEKFSVNDGKIINFIQFAEGKIFEPYLIRNSTHFITTREIINVECLDWLYDTDVKIISALDDNIFDGEPAVNWNEIYS